MVHSDKLLASLVEQTAQSCDVRSCPLKRHNICDTNKYQYTRTRVNLMWHLWHAQTSLRDPSLEVEAWGERGDPRRESRAWLVRRRRKLSVVR